MDIMTEKYIGTTNDTNPCPAKITDRNLLIACLQIIHPELKRKLKRAKETIKRWTDQQDQVPTASTKFVKAHAFADHML